MKVCLCLNTYLVLISFENLNNNKQINKPIKVCDVRIVDLIFFCFYKKNLLIKMSADFFVVVIE